MAKDAYYFNHDSNARNDPKIIAMRTVYGSSGVGWYWMLIEIFREQSDYRLPMDEYTYINLSRQLWEPVKKIRQWVEDCSTKFRDENGTLLQKNEKYLWSDAFLRRMAEIEEKREKAKLSANYRWNRANSQCGDDANALPSQDGRNARKESKGKYSKYTVEDNKVKNIIDNNLFELSEFSPIDAEIIWQKALTILEPSISRSNFNTWLKNTKGLGFNDSDFIINAPSSFTAKYLYENQLSLIEKTLVEITGKNYKLNLIY